MIHFLVVKDLFHARCPHMHSGHVAWLVTEHFASHWSVFYTANLAGVGTQIALRSRYLNYSCRFSGLSFITFNPWESRLLTAGQSLEVEHKRQNQGWKECCSWLLFLVCVTAEYKASQTGSKNSGHPKTRAWVLILPSSNDSVSFPGNSNDSQGETIKGVGLKLSLPLH